MHECYKYLQIFITIRQIKHKAVEFQMGSKSVKQKIEAQGITNETKEEANFSKPTNTQKAKHSIVCSAGNKAVQICIRNQCESKSVFLCFSQDCKCQSEHEDCQKGNISKIQKFIQEKIQNTQPLEQFVQKTRTQMINKINNIMDELVTKIKEEIKYIKLSEIEKKILDMQDQRQSLKSWKVLTPQDSSLLWKIAEERQTRSSLVIQSTVGLLKQFKKGLLQNSKIFSQLSLEAIENQKNIYRNLENILESLNQGKKETISREIKRQIRSDSNQDLQIWFQSDMDMSKTYNLNQCSDYEMSRFKII